MGHRGTRPGPPRCLERRPRRQRAVHAAVQGVEEGPLGAVAQPPGPDPGAAGQAELAGQNASEGAPRVGAQGRTAGGVHPGPPRRQDRGQTCTTAVDLVGAALPHPRIRGPATTHHRPPGSHPHQHRPRPEQRAGRKREHQAAAADQDSVRLRRPTRVDRPGPTRPRRPVPTAARPPPTRADALMTRGGAAPTPPTLPRRQPLQPAGHRPGSSRPFTTGVPRTPGRGKEQASLRSVAAGDPLPRPGNQGPVTDCPTEKTPHTTREIKNVFRRNDQSDTPTEAAGGPEIARVGTGRSGAELVELMRQRIDARTAPPGPATSWLGETIVHGEDVFRALGRYGDHRVEHVVAVADFYKNSNLTGEGVAVLRERP